MLLFCSIRWPQEQKWGYRADSLGDWIELEVGCIKVMYLWAPCSRSSIEACL